MPRQCILPSHFRLPFILIRKLHNCAVLRFFIWMWILIFCLIFSTHVFRWRMMTKKEPKNFLHRLLIQVINSQMKICLGFFFRLHVLRLDHLLAFDSILIETKIMAWQLFFFVSHQHQNFKPVFISPWILQFHQLKMIKSRILKIEYNVVGVILCFRLQQSIHCVRLNWF